MAGEALRHLRVPQVARDKANAKTVITFNGAEDRFYMLQMDDDVAQALARALHNVGFSGETRR